MGNRRLGARRLNSLLSNKFAQDNTNTPAGGAKTFVVTNVISRQGSEVVTEVTVDLGSSEGNATMSGDVNEIIGLSSSAANYVAQGDAHLDAYLTKLTPAVNGYIIGAEMTCVELPDANMRDIDLRAGTTKGRQFSGSVHGSVKVLIEPKEDWTLGGYESTGSFGQEGSLLDTALDDHYLFLTKGSATDGVERTLTQGKFVIRLIGIRAPEDK
jgi:hypothetical protein